MSVKKMYQNLKQKITHTSAKSSLYNQVAKYYDSLNEKDSRITNQTVERILKKYKVKTILDLTCGTGSQALWLTKLGYEVVGYDINTQMLKIAKTKAKEEKMDIKFLKGDMRHVQVGQFDAVITIFSAVGHLTELDFEKAMRNIHKNLKKDGIYVFDIDNINYLLKSDNITKLSIDWLKMFGNIKARKIQYSTIMEDGILASYTTYILQQGTNKPKVKTSTHTLQVYSAKRLKIMLSRNGFKVLDQCSIDGSKFLNLKSDRIVMIAKKVL